MTDVEVEFGAVDSTQGARQKETIPFIGEHETYKYYIGTYDISTDLITWLDGLSTKAFLNDGESHAWESCKLSIDKDRYILKALHE